MVIKSELSCHSFAEEDWNPVLPAAEMWACWGTGGRLLRHRTNREAVSAVPQLHVRRHPTNGVGRGISVGSDAFTDGTAQHRRWGIGRLLGYMRSFIVDKAKKSPALLFPSIKFLKITSYTCVSRMMVTRQTRKAIIHRDCLSLPEKNYKRLTKNI